MGGWLVESRLKHVEEEQSLRLKTQQAVLQAKAAVTEARIKAEAMQESEGVSSVLNEVGPAVSSQDKVGSFLESLQNHDRVGSSVQPDLNLSPTALPNGSLYKANKATRSYLNANTNCGDFPSLRVTLLVAFFFHFLSSVGDVIGFALHVSFSLFQLVSNHHGVCCISVCLKFSLLKP